MSVAKEGNEKSTCCHLNLRHRRNILAFESQTELILYMLLAIYLHKNNSAEQFLMKNYAFTFYRDSNKIIHLLFFSVSFKTYKNILNLNEPTSSETNKQTKLPTREATAQLL